jgi:hypothetical protein
MSTTTDEGRCPADESPLQITTEPPRKTYIIAVPDPNNTTQQRIVEQCQETARYLCEQNQKFGDWVMNPIVGLSDVSAADRIAVYIDAEWQKIQASKEYDRKRVQALIGWLTYLQIMMRDC